MSWAARCAATFVMITIGCGGQVQQRRENQGGTGPGTEPSEGNSQNTDVNEPSTGRLGDCAPGTPMGSAKSCPWYAEQTCYSTKDAACNCICPLDVGEVVCASDFQVEGVPTEVYCYGL